MMPHPLRLSAALLLALGACDSLGDDSREQAPLPGERIAVLNVSRDLTVDSSLAQSPITLAAPNNAHEYQSEMYLQQSSVDNLALTGLRPSESADAGDGHGWDSELLPQPVVASGMVFAMDAKGAISAHDASDVSRVLWVSATSRDEEQSEFTGGGIAYSGGVIYATTGGGSLIALVAADGSLLWRQESDVPMRAAPAISDGKVFAITIDNQLSAFSARTGQLQWSHRGIRESAVYLGSAGPVIENGIVIAAYSSGELFALRAEDGMPLWSDNLVASRRTLASSALSGIAATPLIRDNTVIAVSNNGLMSASLLTSGRGLWDIELASTHTPWIAGEYVFVLSTQGQLIALHRKERRVKWITDLRQMMKNESEPMPRLTAPMLVNSKLMLATNNGEFWWFDPQTGELKERTDAPNHLYSKPAIAGGKMYLLNQKARLYQVE